MEAQISPFEANGTQKLKSIRLGMRALSKKGEKIYMYIYCTGMVHWLKYLYQQTLFFL